MPSDSNEQVNILLSFDTNGTLQRVTQPPGGKAEDAQSIVSTWEIKPNRQDRRNSTAGSPSDSSRGPSNSCC